MSGGSNVLIRSQKVNLRVGQDDAHFANVFDGEFSFAVRAGDSSDGARKVVAFQFFHVGDFEGFEKEIVETHQSQSVGDVETQDKSANEIRSFLKGADILGLLARFQFYVSRFEIKSNLQLQMLHDRRVNFLPILLERSISVVGYWNFSQTVDGVF